MNNRNLKRPRENSHLSPINLFVENEAPQGHQGEAVAKIVV